MKKIPVVILGGADREPVALPEKGRDKHALRGFKGVDIKIGGRPMIRTVIDRLEASGAFGPIFVAGPASIYGPHDLPAELIDTDGAFGENLRSAVRGVRAACPDQPIAFTTCDILPDVDTLKDLMKRYADDQPTDLWFPLVRAPEDSERLGASDWKPGYRIVPDEGATPVKTLPGHLVIADTQSLRLDFIYRLFQLGYSTRNRSIRYRSFVMLRGVLAALLYQDLLHIFGLRLPTLTFDVLGWGFPAARQLRRGTVIRRALENALRRILTTRRHRKRFPERRMQLPIVDAMSIAIDLDTEEEAREQGGVVGSGEPGRLSNVQ